MTYMLLLAFVLVFAALYRLRGGTISDITAACWNVRLGTHATRLLCWVLPITGMFWWFEFSDLPLITSALATAFVFATTWVGIAMGHGTFQDDGQSPQTVNYLVPYMPKYKITDPLIRRQIIDAVGMGLVHFTRAGIIMVGALWFLLSGSNYEHIGLFVLPVLFSGVAYHIGWMIPAGFWNVEARSTEWGEVLTGALYGTGFWLAFIY